MSDRRSDDETHDDLDRDETRDTADRHDPERTTDSARTERAETERADAEMGHDPDEPQQGDEGDDGAGLSGGIALLVAAAVALAVTALAYVWVGGWAGNEVFFEELFRVAPTVAGGGVGADWVTGNTVPVLDALIAIVHAADVLMGVAILAILFIHWAIFRRLADRMQEPAGAPARGTVATDGGEMENGNPEQRGDDR